jgi:hypothetical protein
MPDTVFLLQLETLVLSNKAAKAMIVIGKKSHEKNMYKYQNQKRSM